MELEKAKTIAEEVGERLSPGCQRITIAGSIRRRKSDVNDIELLVIPWRSVSVDMLDHEVKRLISQGILNYRLNKLGRRTYGLKNKLMLHVPSGIGVDIFSTDELCWPMSLVIRTGGKETNKRLATAAINKGWHLQAYGTGFSTPQGDITCKSERDVFELVGMRYLEPWERE